MSVADLGRFWRTVRVLRREQVLGRALFRLRRPRPDLRPSPPLRGRAGAWVVPAARDASLVGPERFCFLSVEHTLSPTPSGWDDPRLERLWRYNLHYFDDLNATDATHRREAHCRLLNRWTIENRPGVGTGWEPYPSSLRIVNWIKWFLGGAPRCDVWLDSLATQVRWLREHIEWHLLGNHIFSNAKALVFAGLFFEGQQANAWLSHGLSILDRQIPEQILRDGGQFERSPMYHALALEDLLDLINIGIALAPAGSRVNSLVAHWRERAGQMLYWLRCMTHPDGALSSFNDSAAGVAPTREAIEAYCTALGVGAAHPQAPLALLADSGYVRACGGGAVVIADVAPLGPEYLAGHAHADTLSFEFSLGLRRVVVNGGTSCYGISERRLRERSTAAHSTVEIDGESSSEVWSGFRVGRRARPVDLEVHSTAFSCSHDGYRYLPGAPVHRRSWALQGGTLRIEDRVRPTGHHAVARYHLAPGLALHADGNAAWRVQLGSELLARVEVQAGTGRQVASEHAPRFGVIESTEALEVALRDGTASTRWSWNANAYSIS